MDGENCRMVFERSFEALKNLTKEPYKNVCVVTHGGVLRALITGIIGADYKNWLTIGRQIENCSISHILYDEKMGTFHIERLTILLTLRIKITFKKTFWKWIF